MKIKKTVGKAGLGGDRKDYVIHTECGEKFYAKAVGSQGYECGGLFSKGCSSPTSFKSLKELKAHIEADGFADDDNEPDEVSMLSGEDTWDCVHPCALLITKPRSFDGDLLRTLENYGWLDVMGRPDIARAEREIKRVKNLRNPIDDPN